MLSSLYPAPVFLLSISTVVDIIAQELVAQYLREELDAMAARGQLPPELKTLRADLDALRAPKSGTA